MLPLAKKESEKVPIWQTRECCIGAFITAVACHRQSRSEATARFRASMAVSVMHLISCAFLSPAFQKQSELGKESLFAL